MALRVTTNRTAPSLDAAFRRPGLIAAFVSNCGSGARNALLEQLHSVVPVDHFGTCYHNTDAPPTRANADWLAVKEATLATYRFAIAFENKV